MEKISIKKTKKYNNGSVFEFRYEGIPFPIFQQERVEKLLDEYMNNEEQSFDMAKKEKEQEDTVKEIKKNISEPTTQSKKDRKLLFTTIYVLCFFAIGVNLIKDGLTTWVPSILKDEFKMSDSISILLTLLLPVLAVFGNVIALRIHKMIPDYVHHCAAVFAVIAVFIGVIIGSLALEFVLLMLFGLIVANFLASSLNSIVTGIFPMFMRGKINSGLYAGVLNGFCYVGSAISSYGLGAIADHFGWTSVFWVLMGFCVLTCIVWIGYSCVKRCLKENISE